ncbi:MAG: cysteine hydrolase [Rhodospirillales bacterium]|nr:cysteine hydrolase [Rhodospirillales bacterium]
MLVLSGREVLTEMSEIVDPAHTALVLIDLTIDDCGQGGFFANQGRDMSLIDNALRNSKRILEAARQLGVLRIHVDTPWWPNHKNISGPWLRFMITKRKMDPTQEGCMVAGTKGVEFMPDFKPRPDELIVSKWRSSSFTGTNLDMVLRVNNIKTLMCIGVTTEGCIESTARDSVFHDYYTVVLEDCVGTYDRDLHEASLKVQRSRVDVVHSDEVMKIWSGKAGAKPRRVAAE